MELIPAPALMAACPLSSETKSPFDSFCLLAMLESIMPEAFMAENSDRLDIASAASTSTHWPVSCFRFHRSLNFKHASLWSG